jgi:hypothetical protein
MEIVSYRTVFDLERRIYRIDRLRLNPGGLPLRGIVYFAVIAVVALLIAKLPLIGTLARDMSWYLRDLAAPGAVAALLTIVRVEGRPFHLAVRALAFYALSPRHLAGLRPCPTPGGVWRPGELLMLPDGSDATLRRLRYTGPGAALVSVAHLRREYDGGAARHLFASPGVTLGPLVGRRAPAHGQVIALRAGVRLRVKR